MKIQYGLQMTQNLNDFLTTQTNKKYATQSGTKIHALLKNIVLDNKSGDVGNSEIIEQIKQYPELKQFFGPSAQTEVPIAGHINNVFLSRRIDRLLIDTQNKSIMFIDYKTDINKETFIDIYKKQLREYAQLLQSAFPGYKITGFILWIHDWQLEQIIYL